MLERILLSALLVAPVRRDPVFARAMHFEGADLHLEGIAARTHDRRVQRLIHVGFGHRDVIFEAARQRLPMRMDHTERAVAILDSIDDYAYGSKVVNVRPVVPFAQFIVDRIKMLGPAGDIGFDPQV